MRILGYLFDKENRTATFTIPAGVTDVGAMKAINKYFRKNLPGLGRDAIDPRELEWLENLPKEFPEHCQKRDYSKARQITIEGVVTGTKNERWLDQADVLKQRSLVISDPRDQFIAAALHACNHRGADLFQGLGGRCSVPGAMVMSSINENGVSVVKLGISGEAMSFIAASGSPRESK